MRLLYLLYYLKKLDWKLFLEFIRFTRKQYKIPYLKLIIDSIFSTLKYNVSILEYYQFSFYNKSASERKLWAGTGFMYEYQLRMNPKSQRHYLEDKKLFLEKFKDFVKHDWLSLEQFEKNRDKVDKLITNPSGKLVIKRHDGQCGIGVEVIQTAGLTYEKLLDRMNKTNNTLVEEYIVQHPDLMALSPSGLNTVRIYTQLNKNDEVEILGCRLRISINSVVDNLAAGNVAAPIDENTGIVTGPGVYSHIAKADEYTHPITKIPIVGFRIPFWNQTIEFSKRAALHLKECRSIGWDIAITADGPELIEGNHDWCKLVWQLPVKKGLKPLLERYLKN